jgi:hypothetical protein
MDIVNIFHNFGVVILWVGVLDALFIMLLASVLAVDKLFHFSRGSIYIDRFISVIAILLVGSLASVLVMLLARWIASFFGVMS